MVADGRPVIYPPRDCADTYGRPKVGYPTRRLATHVRRVKRVMDQHVKTNMKACLTDIQSGKFANDWMKEYREHGFTKMQKEIDQLAKHDLETVGMQVRKAMWPLNKEHQ